MPLDLQQQVIDEFRANAGRVGRPFEGARLLLLTTTGARSGAPHTVPLAYLPDGGHQFLVIGSAGGSPRHPAWFHNLVAQPRVTVEDGVFIADALAVVLEGGDRDQAFTRAVETDPGWAEYEERSGRVLPVVSLRPLPGPPRFAAGPAVSGGAALTRIHDAFRRELALIRAEVAAAGTSVGAQLRVNCLTLCAGLHNHHAGEDGALFPLLAAQRPDLAATLERLHVEHERIAALVAQLQATVDGPGDPLLLRREVDRLTDELERHLSYEEEQLVPALDAALG
ncbi:deazaflavin-dependent oxidoreductase (nitroreductase family) [Pseudonocardia hierapolitana]|uniref:Deazaflavin-dependent oxidoreductase (Nitroreductase family) n=1 Tax=Pseudonocardia hierapolitana TaxID=1128676 RepID=A0A561SSH7_9PSEU|nr:nitroreductase/quinone reductase family protein [Pseudonocardia hierapolitana]TWF77785.1 deazaflavin-dependent oxidoreductase (nitroreductase family) [Pseudonocardia hierapolitana]